MCDTFLFYVRRSNSLTVTSLVVTRLLWLHQSFSHPFSLGGSINHEDRFWDFFDPSLLLDKTVSTKGEGGVKKVLY